MLVMLKRHFFSNVEEQKKKNNNTVKHLVFGCDKFLTKFNSRDRLKEHMKKAHLHNLEQCTKCEISFDTNINLKKHFEIYHALSSVDAVQDLSFKLLAAGSLELLKRK